MSTPRQKRIALGIVIGALLLTSFFLAKGTMQLVAGAVLATGPVEPGEALAAGEGAGRTKRDITPVLRRNIFSSEQGSIENPPAEEVEVVEEPDTEVVEPNENPYGPFEVCEGSMRLVAAVVVPNHPERSFASIVTAAGRATLYREGQTIDGKTLEYVLSRRVIIAPGGASRCELRLFNESPEAPRMRVVAAAMAPMATAMASRPSRAGRNGGISAEDMDSSITRVSDTNFNIERSLVDRVLGNQAELMNTARVIPHQEGDRTVGVKVYGIRRNSLLGRLGVQNGDMLRTINGYDMSDPATALEAYTRLQSANSLTLNVVRRGNPVTLNYNIQ